MRLRLVSLAAVTGLFLVVLGTAAAGAPLAGSHHLLSADMRPVGVPVVSPNATPPAAPGASAVPGKVLVRFRSLATPATRSRILSRAGTSVERAYTLVPGLELLRLPSGTSTTAALAMLAQNPAVKYVVPDLVTKVAATPNDPRYVNQWAPAAIGAPAAWDRTTGGASVTVAVLDTGVQLDHPDLAANLVPGWNFIDNTAIVSDAYGHGTHVAGIIGAVGNNGTGVTGLNWQVSLMPLKVCTDYGSCSLDAEISAIQYAVTHGAKVANASFGGNYPANQAEQNAIAAAGDAGLLFVAAAGNETLDDGAVPFYPASYPLDNIVSVAATDSSGGLAYFSNFGIGSVSLAAPGQDIVSTMISSGPLSDASGYGSLSGTSMAAPQVSGAAALLWAEHPGWTMQQVRMRLLTTASALPSLAGNVSDCGQLNIGAATDPSVPDRGIVCVGLNGSGAGTVTSDPAALDCGTTCAASLTPGTALTLSATPTSGSTFVGWGGACSGSGSCQVTASTISDVTATFRASGNAPGWQQKRLLAPYGRDPFVPGTQFVPGQLSSFGWGTFYNVAVSANGLERADAVYNATGSCYNATPDNGGVFLERRTSTGWTPDGSVEPPIVPGYAGDPEASWERCDNFGRDLQLSADGTTLVAAGEMAAVYDPNTDGFFDYRCAVYVYQRVGNAWSSPATIYPPGIDAHGSADVEACGYFGSQTALSADGSRLAVFGAGLNGPNNYVNKVYVYTLTLGVWGLEQTIVVPKPTAHCAAGIGERYMSLSGDGSSMLVGDPMCDDTVSGWESGLVFAYSRSGTHWTLAQTLRAPTPGQWAYFGSGTALSQDGKTAVITSDGDNARAWVFERGPSGWTLSQKLPVGTGPVECPVVVENGARIVCDNYNQQVGYTAYQGMLSVIDRPPAGWASGGLQAQQLFGSDGAYWERLGRANPDEWMTVAAPEDGSFVEAPIEPTRYLAESTPHDRIGYFFTTGPVDATLTVSASGGGTGAVTSNLAGITCGVTCTHDYAPGTAVTLTATPSGTSSFSGWTGDCSGTGTCNLTMDADHSVGAVFEIGPKLSVTRSGTGAGGVSSSPAGINCPSSCASFFTAGATVQLTATPNIGSTFGGWSGACSGTGTCSVSMTQARDVTATFTALPPVSLTVSKSGSGTVVASPSGITCGTQCSHTYPYGTKLSLHAAPASGFLFAGWSGDCAGSAPVCNLTMMTPHVVTAMFGKPKVLSFVKAGTGSGTVKSSPAGISCSASCKHSFGQGAVVNLTATAKAGSTFTGWSGACAGTGKCVVTMSAAKTVKATFAHHSAVRAAARAVWRNVGSLLTSTVLGDARSLSH